MATKCGRFISRTSLSSLRSAVNSNLRSASVEGFSASSSSRFSLPTRSAASPIRRCSLSRTPSELGGVMSLLPLHNAVSSARMTSCLSTSSRSCRALSQELGQSVPR